MRKPVSLSCLMLFFLVGCTVVVDDVNAGLTDGVHKDLTGTVSITGTPMVGQTLRANTDGLGGTGTIRYRWKRMGVNVGTGNTYVPVAADIGQTITVTVSRVGYTGSKISVAKGPVVAAGTFDTPDTPDTPDTNDLPIVYINTENNAQIVSKDNYLNATIRVVENSVTTMNSAVQIKGRGNWTWGMPKKPYKLKFDSKTALLGMPQDKEWVLLANWNDITALRTDTALFMGSLSNLEWTPRAKFAEVYLNGSYNGVYQVCEQVKIATDRVNVTDNGYLLEIEMFPDRRAADIAAGDMYISTNRLYLNMKDGNSDSTTIQNYVRNVETLLYSSNTPGTTNYAQSLDIPSFVDYYLINEIYQRNDPMMSSCFLHKAPGGKLKMGPLWDFDGDRTGYWKDASWFAQLFKDPAFVSQVKTRLAYFKSQKAAIQSHIDARAAYLKSAVEKNNSHWGVYMSNYNNEVQQDMKNWLNQRFTSVEAQLSGL